MTQFEFVKYEETPGEKYLGIATVKAYGKIILRYKIVQTKDGQGYFPAAASYKLPAVDGEDTYVSCFLIDSRSDEEELQRLIRTEVKRYYGLKNTLPDKPISKPLDDLPSYLQQECPF